MSIGGHPVELDPSLDSLINVTALGDPAYSARFMGGREHDLATGGPYPEPTEIDRSTVLAQQIMLRPAVCPESGPFKGHRPFWVGGEPQVGTGVRGAAVALYLALVTAECLKNIGHAGPIIIEGPFAKNRFYLEMLAATTGSDVCTSSGTTGTSSGAAMLADESSGNRKAQNAPLEIPRDTIRALRQYADLWRIQAI